jgi:hypothetical protein
VYPRDQIPVTDAERKACTSGIIDSCTSTNEPAACLASWAGLMVSDSHPITIPAGASFVVYVAAWYDDTSSSPHDGKYVLSVKTEALQ